MKKNKSQYIISSFIVLLTSILMLFYMYQVITQQIDFSW